MLKVDHLAALLRIVRLMYANGDVRGGYDLLERLIVALETNKP